jgi:hypothetical protein
LSTPSTWESLPIDDDAHAYMAHAWALGCTSSSILRSPRLTCNQPNAVRTRLEEETKRFVPSRPAATADVSVRSICHLTKCTCRFPSRNRMRVRRRGNGAPERNARARIGILSRVSSRTETAPFHTSAERGYPQIYPDHICGLLIRVFLPTTAFFFPAPF